MQRSELVLGKGTHKVLQQKTAVIIGVGGTGCVVADLLARYGIHLIIIDRDIIEETNLERQNLFDKSEVNKPKVLIAKEKLGSFCKVTPFFKDVHENNIEELIPKEIDLIIDCTDNNETRLLINDYAKKHKIPWIYSGAIERKGALCFFHPKDNACFQCIYQEKYGETCSEVGVLNSTVTAIASFVVDQAMTFLVHGKYQKHFTHIDIKNQNMVKIKLKNNPHCKACQGNYDYLSGKNMKKIITLCGKDTFAINLGKNIDLEELQKRLQKNLEKQGKNNRHQTSNKQNEKIMKTKDILKTDDFLIFSHGRIIVKSNSKENAKKKFDEHIGII